MRNNMRTTFLNDSKEYAEIMRKKNVKWITQYDTPTLTHLQDKDFSLLTLVPHIWKTGDRFYKLAYQYYNEPQYWWIIAWINKTPTEAHVKAGDTIYISLSLEQTLSLLDYN
tara:strand:+ start:4646 stop:4981 length:336 start_codon:yes stop_codon:yes gene_type:complete